MKGKMRKVLAALITTYLMSNATITFAMPLTLSIDEAIDMALKNNYNIKVVKKKQLEAFEQELALMSGVVIKGEYELTGVNIEFDRRFRPVKKTFRLQALDESQMHEEKKDEKKCIQEFGYNIGKVRFQTSYRDVEKKIQKEWKKILEAERTEALLPYRNQ